MNDKISDYCETVLFHLGTVGHTKNCIATKLIHFNQDNEIYSSLRMTCICKRKQTIYLEGSVK